MRALWTLLLVPVALGCSHAPRPVSSEPVEPAPASTSPDRAAGQRASTTTAGKDATATQPPRADGKPAPDAPPPKVIASGTFTQDKTSFTAKPPVGTKAICPVSGEELTVAADTPTSTYKGRTYVFCCPDCKSAFDKDPARYVAGIGRTR